ncbi:hypothetical protein CONCODRAFT_77603, partial [Conidiobolus coronatus NRRL 28638]
MSLLSAKSIEIDKFNGVYKDYMIAECCFVGVLGGTCTAYVIMQLLKRRKPYHIDTILCLIATGVDFLISIGLMIRGLLCKFPYNTLAYHTKQLCPFEFLTVSFWTMAGAYCVGVMAMERYLLVVYNKHLPRYVWFSILALAISIQFGLMCAVAGSGSLVLSNIAVSCVVGPNTPLEFFPKASAVLYIITYIVTVYCYIGIMVTQCLRTISNRKNLNISISQTKREIIPIILRASLILILFTIGYGGKIYCWVWEWVTGKLRTWTMDYTANMLLNLNSIFNLLIILYMNNELKYSLLKKFNLKDF